MLQTLILIKSKRQQGCTEIRKKYLLKRALLELAELLTPKKVTDDELKGRSSGSLNWKLSRGEQNINTVSFLIFFYGESFNTNIFLTHSFTYLLHCLKNV